MATSKKKVVTKKARKKKAVYRVASAEVSAKPNYAEKKLLMKKPKAISIEQWELPAGYKPDGSFASLAEVMSDPVPTFSLESLTGQDKKKLVIERIKLQPDYPTRYMLGVGEVNKERAITEVDAGTQAGKFIQESEQMVIQLMKQNAFKK
jgi:hypothetical protein